MMVICRKTHKNMNTESNDNRANQGAGSSSGKPRKQIRPRDASRMYEFNRNRAEQWNNWADEVEVEARYDSTKRAPRQPQQEGDFKKRPPNRRGKKKPKADDEPQSTVSSPSSDDSKFDGAAGGSVPKINRYCHNLDFSGFPQLIRQTYESMGDADDRMRRKLPFCLFNYYCTILLNAKLIYVLQAENGDISLRSEGDINFIPDTYFVPEPIEGYINSITKHETLAGDVVYVNIPTAAIPLRNAVNAHAGSFGRVTAVNHNLYECYVAPIIAMRYIIATRERNFNWEPLPAGLRPDNAVPTRNLIGYYPVEQIHQDAMVKIANLQFANLADYDLVMKQWTV